MSASEPQIVKQTKDYRVIVAPRAWDAVQKGELGYLVVNRLTNVTEGEGSVMWMAMEYADQLQAGLEAYYDQPAPKGFGGRPTHELN